MASKPDLYPIVMCNGFNIDSSQKLVRASTGYLMVQYFRNYIVRPVGTSSLFPLSPFALGNNSVSVSGTLSATSTMDSLGSSFVCSATNEVKTTELLF